MVGSQTTGQAASQRALRRNGILITLGTLIAIEVLTRAVFRVPTPGAILLMPVAYAAFTGGLRTGLISATMIFLYALYFFAAPGPPWHYTRESLQTIMVLAVVAVGMAWMTGNLKQRIEQLSHRNQLILNSAGEGICGLNAEGRITFLNPAAARMCGWAVEELIGQPLHVLLNRPHPDEPRASHTATPIGTALQDPSVYAVMEAVLWRKDGTCFPIEYIRSPIQEQSKRVGAVITFKDITERKSAEEAIKQLNADLERRVMERTAQLEATNKELEAFSSSVSHDLRAPLRSIDGFSQALLEDYGEKLDAHGQDYLQRVRAATQRMGQLIDDLLSLARVTRSELRHEPVDLSALAATIADELQHMQPDRPVAFVIAPGLVAHGDGRLLQVVLANLLGNAWKFTVKHPCANIEFGAIPHEGRMTYFVRDDGAGFEMAYANKLFGTFQRLHTTIEFAGTGIGLATVQRIIQRHGGRVWAKGAVEQGATFYFTL